MENQNYKDSNPTSPVTEQTPDISNSLGLAIDDMDEEAAAKERLTSDDPTKVVFISANSEYTRKNGDAKVDIENVQRSVGMGKEELMKYANDPFWVRLRMTLFVLFWFLWIAMLVGSVVIIFVAPRCPPPPTLDWWQKTVVYQVMVGSYKDSDRSGVGDIKGLISKLDYLQENKIDTVLLSNILSSPTPFYGKAISNFTEVDKDFGTMEDFEALVEEMDKKDMKLLIELIPNHSSEKHPWFQKSIKRENPYTNYYIWADSKTPGKIEPPNNWHTVVNNEVAWTWNAERKQFYLNQFGFDQPDLNLTDPLVRSEIKDIFWFWLDKGVDGFYIKHFDHLVEDNEFLDEPKNPSPASKSKYDQLSHIYTLNQPTNFEILQEWRDFIDSYSANNASSSHKRIILTSLTSELNPSITTRLYGNSSSPLSDIPFYTGLINIPATKESQYIVENMNASLNSIPSGLWPNWVLGTAETKRLASRVGPQLVDAIHTIALLSKGTPVLYYGDEIGMENTTVRDDLVQDPYATVNGIESKDAVKTPMQWDNSNHGGFSDAINIFLPLFSNYSQVNVLVENSTSHSHLKIFQKLMSLRSNPSIQFGSIELHASAENVFSMVRVRKGNPGYLIAVNFGTNDTYVDLTKTNAQVNDNGKIELATLSSSRIALSDMGHPTVEMNNVPIGAKQSLVFSFVPKQT